MTSEARAILAYDACNHANLTFTRFSLCGYVSALVFPCTLILRTRVLTSAAAREQSVLRPRDQTQGTNHKNGRCCERTVLHMHTMQTYVRK